jgi:glutathione S-transferase
MKLLFASTSAFVRKVMICAHLSGLAERIEKLDSAAHPVQRDARIGVHNPLAKVPTLVLDDGMSLYDSRVICEFIAHTGCNTHLFPAAGPARWQALQQQALGDGLLDAALLARYEHTARPAAVQWPVWRQANLTKVQACLSSIEAVAPTLGVSQPTIGDIAIACALGYLDFRFPELQWRASCPRAAAWFARFDALPAMQHTRPYELPQP